MSFDRRSVFRWIAWAQRRAGRRRAAATTYLRAALSERSPGDLVRAGAALIGERAMREPARGTQGQPPAPAWLTRSVWRVPSNALCSSRYRGSRRRRPCLLRTAEAVSRRWPRPWRGRRRRRSCSRPSERACPHSVLDIGRKLGRRTAARNLARFVRARARIRSLIGPAGPGSGRSCDTSGRSCLERAGRGPGRAVGARADSAPAARMPPARRALARAFVRPRTCSRGARPRAAAWRARWTEGSHAGCGRRPRAGASGGRAAQLRTRGTRPGGRRMADPLRRPARR